MKYLISILLLVGSFHLSIAQSYDLIITAKGDSIACQIDSLNESYVFFTMKNNNNWISTRIQLKQVRDFKYDAIDKKLVVFQPKTSYIARIREEAEITVHNLQKNSFWLGILTINYGRMIPANDRVGISLSAGLSFIDGIEYAMFQMEGAFLIGGPKHFFEPGLFYFTDYNDHIFLIRTGYRYQAPKGFLIRVAPLITYIGELAVLPSLCIGYSF